MDPMQHVLRQFAATVILLALPLASQAQLAIVDHKPVPPEPPIGPPYAEAASKTMVDPNYATMYGGSGYDELLAQATAGNVACMAGVTNSTDLTLFAPFQADIGGMFDGWVACGDAETGIPFFASYLGADLGETIVAADIYNDTLFVAGSTQSDTMPGTDTTSYQQMLGGGGQDCFISRMSAIDGGGLKTTFFGLGGQDFCASINVNSSGVWIAGSSSMEVELVNPFQQASGGTTDGFMARLDRDLTTLQYSTMIGAEQSDGITGMQSGPLFDPPGTGKSEDDDTISHRRRLVLIGFTDSNGLITTDNAHRPERIGGLDFFLMSFIYDPDTDEVALEYSSYGGGTADDVAEALDYHKKRATIAGWTTSNGWTNVGRERNGGSLDGFVYYDKFSDEMHNPSIAYAGPSPIYNLPLAVVRAVLGLTILGGYAVVPGLGNAFMQALDRQYRVVGNEFAGGEADADCNTVVAVLYWWICGGKTAGPIIATALAIQAVYGGGPFDMFGAEFASPWGYSFLFNMTDSDVTGTLHDRDIEPVFPRTLSSAHFIPWDIAFVYVLANAIRTYQFERLLTIATARIVFSYLFADRVLNVEVPEVGRYELGILAYNDLGRPIEVIRYDQTPEHNELQRTTVEAGQFFFIPLPKDQNVGISDGTEEIIYTPPKRYYRKGFPYLAGVLQDRVLKGAGAQEFELLLFDAGGDPADLPVTTSSEDDAAPIAERTALLTSHPNPFGQYTTLRFDIPQAMQVRLAIYDIMGRKVATVVDGMRAAGIATEVWNGLDDSGRRIASGTYLARLEGVGLTATKTMIVSR